MAAFTRAILEWFQMEKTDPVLVRLAVPFGAVPTGPVQTGGLTVLILERFQIKPVSCKRCHKGTLKCLP